MGQHKYSISKEINKRCPKLPHNKNFQLIFKNQKIDDGNVTLKAPVHNDKVTVLHFTGCQLFQIPAIASLHESFPNLTVLDVFDSKLAVIDKSHLQPYPFLKELYLEHNIIRRLPGDLFEYTLDLQIISFRNNPITTIENPDGILDGLHGLLYLNLLENYTLDILFDAINYEGNVQLDELKEKLKVFNPNAYLWNMINEMKHDSLAWAKKVEHLERKIGHMQEQYTKDIRVWAAECNTLIEKLENAKSELKGNRGHLTEDFTVKVGDKNFNVHKAIISAYSAVLAKLIAESDDIEGIDLKGIKESTFQAILNYMYHETLTEDINVIDLFSACGYLKIDSLSKLLVNKLKDHITSENAIEILVSCEAYLSDEVKLLAFDKFKESLNSSVEALTLDRIELNPENLEVLMKMKKDLEEMVAAE